MVFERKPWPQLRLKKSWHFLNPPVRIELFRKIPLYSLPTEWNNLGEHIRLQRNRTTFKIALTDFLFDNILQPPLWWLLSWSLRAVIPIFSYFCYYLSPLVCLGRSCSYRGPHMPRLAGLIPPHPIVPSFPFIIVVLNFSPINSNLRLFNLFSCNLLLIWEVCENRTWFYLSSHLARPPPY